MHTKVGEGVSREKIKQVKTPDGKTDMLSIIIYEYDKHKDDVEPIEFLHQFKKILKYQFQY